MTDGVWKCSGSFSNLIGPEWKIVHNSDFGSASSSLEHSLENWLELTQLTLRSQFY